MFLLLVLQGLTGCAGLYLHNPQRQQQAEALTKAWSDVDAAQVFKTERQNLQQLAEAEVATAARVGQAQLGHLATAITAAGPAQSVRSSVRSPADDGVKALVGSRQAVAAAEQAHGAWQGALTQLKTDQDAVTEGEKRATQHGTALRQAVKDYQDALDKAKAQAPTAPVQASLSDEVRAKAEALQTLVSQLNQAQGAFERQLIATKTLEALDSQLQAVVAGEADADAPDAVLLAVRLPKLIDRFRNAQTTVATALAAPMLMQREDARLRAAAATADVQRLKQKVVVSQSLVDAVLAQAKALDKAISELDDAEKAAPGLLDKPWSQAWATPDAQARRLLLSGTARYLDAATRLEASRYQLAYRHIALDHDRALAYAESNAALWSNLIGSGIADLDAFAKGGVSKDTLTELAKVLGVFWIARGVNQ